LRRGLGNRHRLLRAARFTPDARLGAPVFFIAVKRLRFDKYPILHFNKESKHWRSGGVGKACWNKHWSDMYHIHLEEYKAWAADQLVIQ
jgi:hypothetical protein